MSSVGAADIASQASGGNGGGVASQRDSTLAHQDLLHSPPARPRSSSSSARNLLEKVGLKAAADKVPLRRSEGEEVKEGFLYKQGSRVKNWKRRWFVLNFGTRELSYYSAPHSRWAKGKMEITDGSKIDQDVGEDVAKSLDKDIVNPYLFALRSPKRGQFIRLDANVLFMCASSEDERRSWMDALKRSLRPVLSPRSRANSFPSRLLVGKGSFADEETFGGNNLRGQLHASGSMTLSPQAKATSPRSPLSQGKMVDQYRIIKDLGRGAFATVKLVSKVNQEDASKEAFFAMKVFNKSLLKRQREFKRVGRRMVVSTGLDKVQEEIAIMKKLEHQNLVRLYEVMDDDEEMLLMVLEYCEGGQVLYYNGKLKRYELPRPGRSDDTPLESDENSPSAELEDEDSPAPPLPPTELLLSETTVRLYLRSIVQGLAYLHQHHICHRDLKPENLLLSSLHHPELKIADFGVARYFAEEVETIVGDSKRLMIGKLVDTQGTYQFLAPEALLGGEFSGYAADVWALGVTIYVFLYGSLPFFASSTEKLFERITNKELKFPVPISEGLKDLLTKMLAKDPKERISVSSIMHHPWVNEGGLVPLVSIRQPETVTITPEDVARAFSPIGHIELITKVKIMASSWKTKARHRAASRESSRSSGGVSANELPTEVTRYESALHDAAPRSLNGAVDLPKPPVPSMVVLSPPTPPAAAESEQMQKAMDSAPEQQPPDTVPSS